VNWIITLAIAVAVAASAEDVWRRRISNPTTACAFAGGVALHLWLDGLAGAGDALLGGAIGFLAFLIFYVRGGMGGGDIKLMAGFGAIVGSDLAVLAVVMAALTGGLMALGFLGVQALRRAFRRGAPEAGLRRDLKHSIPYAPAISLGALLSFLTEDSLWTSVC